jgi:hypothetical protein
MKKYLISFLLLALVQNSFSQTLVVGYAKMKYGSGFQNTVKKYWIPLAEKEVEKGNLLSYSNLGHNMGDGYNNLDVYEAKNYASFQKAWDNITSQYGKNTPADVIEGHFSKVLDHKDNIYQVMHSKHSGADGGSLIAWYGKVHFADLSDYNDHMKKYLYPIWDEQVNNGGITGYKVLNHSWGDEWSVVVHYEAKDFETFQKSWSTATAQYQKDSPKRERDKYFKMVMDHKDNIYTVRSTKRQ